MPASLCTYWIINFIKESKGDCDSVLLHGALKMNKNSAIQIVRTKSVIARSAPQRLKSTEDFISSIGSIFHCPGSFAEQEPIDPYDYRPKKGAKKVRTFAHLDQFFRALWPTLMNTSHGHGLLASFRSFSIYLLFVFFSFYIVRRTKNRNQHAKLDTEAMWL